MSLLSSLFGQKKTKQTPLQIQVQNAKNGDPDSILAVGWDCRRGVSMELTREEVGQLLEKLAAQGNGEAMVILGDLYNPQSMFTIRKDSALALKWYDKACKAGYSKASHSAGMLFMGKGDIPRNYAKAAAYFRMGADAGDAIAARELGKLCDSGRGGMKDLPKALFYYKKAVDSGDFEAPFRLGDLYYFGRGVAVDKAKAAELYQQSKAKNYADAEAMLDFMMLKGEIPLKGTDEEVFYHIVRLAEGFSQNRANYLLGLFFETGTFVDQDLAKSIRYYEKSAKTGNLSAMRKVSLLEKKDFPGHAPDMEKSCFWEKQFQEELG